MIKGLNGIEDHHCGGEICHGSGYGAEVRFRQDHEVVGFGVDPLGPHTDLTQRLLGGHVKDPGPGSGHAREDLQKEGGFADPRISAEEDHGAGDHAAAEDPVKLGKAGRNAPGEVLRNAGDRGRGL